MSKTNTLWKKALLAVISIVAVLALSVAFAGAANAAVVKPTEPAKTKTVTINNKDANGKVVEKMDLATAIDDTKYVEDATTVTFDGTFSATNESIKKLGGFKAATEIVGLNKIDVSNVTNFTDTFKGDNALKSVDLTSWNIGSYAQAKQIITSLTGLTGLESFKLPEVEKARGENADEKIGDVTGTWTDGDSIITADSKCEDIVGIVKEYKKVSAKQGAPKVTVENNTIYSSDKTDGMKPDIYAESGDVLKFEVKANIADDQKDKVAAPLDYKYVWYDTNNNVVYDSSATYTDKEDEEKGKAAGKIASIGDDNEITAEGAGTLKITVSVQGDKEAATTVKIVIKDAEGRQTLYRLYNPNTGEHFYTVNETEREATINAGWTDENIAYYVADNTSDKDAQPVYRLYNKNNGGEHHYTTANKERNALVKAGWKNEGIVFYVPKTGANVYRVYNKHALANNHFFTGAKNEYKSLLKAGWTDENIAWHAVAVVK